MSTLATTHWVAKIDWDRLPMDGRPYLAAATARVDAAVAARIEWIEAGHAGGAALLDNVRGNQMQIFRVGGRTNEKSSGDLRAKLADKLEFALQHGVAQNPSYENGYRGMMGGVRHLLGRGLRPGEDRLVLRVLRGPHLRAYTDADGFDCRELLVECTLEATGVRDANPGGIIEFMNREQERLWREDFNRRVSALYRYTTLPFTAVNNKENNMAVKSSQLQVGDRLRATHTCTPSFQKGDEFVVTDCIGPARGWDYVRIEARNQRTGHVVSMSDGPGNYLSLVELVSKGNTFRAGDRVRVVSSPTSRLPISSVHTVADTSGGRFVRLADSAYWWSVDRFALADKGEQASTMPLVTKRILTAVTVRCASGDGDTMTIGYDPIGSASHDGPCVDFTFETSSGAGGWLGVDIEDIQALDTVIAALKGMRADFHKDTAS